MMITNFYQRIVTKRLASPLHTGQRRYFLIKMVMYTLGLCISCHINAQPCTPVYMGGCSGMGPGGASGMGIDINDLTINGDAGTIISDLATSCSAGSPTGWRIDTMSSITVHPGGTYTVSVNSNMPGGNIQAFVDFDNNATFTATESVGGTNGVSSSPASTTFTINIPATAATGTHYFRFNVSPALAYPSINGCPVPITSTIPPSSNGETHDYKINIVAPSTCTTPTGLTASSVTSTSADISWATVSGAIGYEYVINTSSTAPSGSGTLTTSSSTSASTLSPATIYYAHVRTKCSSTSFSTWTTYTFTTLSTASCTPVASLTPSGITNTSATITWPAVTGSMGYQYVVNTSSATPSGSGTATTATTISPTGLTPSTVYYVYVRDSCSATSLSSWVSTTFTTSATAPSCLPVGGLSVTGVTNNSATISWTAFSGNAGYKYLINTTSAAPTTPGIFTTSNSTLATGLMASTIYFAHIQDTCGPGNVSSWKTIAFTTLSATEIHDVPEVKKHVLVHPNPVKDRLAITIIDGVGSNAILQLTDISGRTLKTIAMDEQRVTIDIADLPSGMYIIKYTDSNQTETVKIIK